MGKFSNEVSSTYFGIVINGLIGSAQEYQDNEWKMIGIKIASHDDMLQHVKS